MNAGVGLIPRSTGAAKGLEEHGDRTIGVNQLFSHSFEMDLPCKNLVLPWYEGLDQFGILDHLIVWIYTAPRYHRNDC